MSGYVQERGWYSDWLWVGLFAVRILYEGKKFPSYPSRLTLGLTKLPEQWVPELCSGSKADVM